ncbi:N-acyl homoserine lactonase family protein [Zobellia galactanivorans]|uniref:N-acyl homoserine lactonase family protein n=1 Tax=Zobellia galactanivorans (strain DSM 12802 / CCUG 47099 / CIP 106680 / NCIMB 13871 / Dsij) TaxID=63186 RepID=UPI001C07BF19|nr:N-acyl homoserine lactonase family protein [Zobellia galactanivorans]MBU3026048.1 N-acyl homoserine lactonase family protein [Zobellia galactanivorans]
MQRSDFIEPTGNAALQSIVPIGHFTQTDQDYNSFAQSKIDSIVLPTAINKVATQTTTVKCNGKSVKIHAIQTGTVAVKKSHITNRTAHFLTPIKISLDRHFTEFMPIWVWVIEHPEGNIVIDTGENANVANPGYFDPIGKLAAAYSKKNFKFKVSQENEIGFQLRQLGIKKDSIKNVILTHLHIDHTDGLKDFKNVEIIVSEKEYKNPSGHFPELVPNWFKPKTVRFQTDFVEVFNEAFPLTKAEDLLLIPTQGHTKHHTSVLFKTDECDILFAGDVCYNQEQLITNDLPGINVSYKETKNTYEKIKTYAKYNKLIFLPSHDIDSGQRLTNKTELEVR